MHPCYHPTRKLFSKPLFFVKKSPVLAEVLLIHGFAPALVLVLPLAFLQATPDRKKNGTGLLQKLAAMPYLMIFEKESYFAVLLYA